MLLCAPFPVAGTLLASAILCHCLATSKPLLMLNPQAQHRSDSAARGSPSCPAAEQCAQEAYLSCQKRWLSCQPCLYGCPSHIDPSNCSTSWLSALLLQIWGVVISTVDAKHARPGLWLACISHWRRPHVQLSFQLHCGQGQCQICPYLLATFWPPWPAVTRA